MQHEKELERMRMEFQLKLEELKNEQQKMAMLTQGIRQIGMAAASALSEEGETFSENPPAMGMKKPIIEEEKPSEGGELVTLKCPKCGGDITFPKTAEIVTCPHCGSKFKVKKEE